MTCVTVSGTWKLREADQNLPRASTVLQFYTSHQGTWWAFEVGSH